MTKVITIHFGDPDRAPSLKCVSLRVENKFSNFDKIFGMLLFILTLCRFDGQGHWSKFKIAG